MSCEVLPVIVGVSVLG